MKALLDFWHRWLARRRDPAIRSAPSEAPATDPQATLDYAVRRNLAAGMSLREAVQAAQARANSRP